MLTLLHGAPGISPTASPRAEWSRLPHDHQHRVGGDWPACSCGPQLLLPPGGLRGAADPKGRRRSPALCWAPLVSAAAFGASEELDLSPAGRPDSTVLGGNDQAPVPASQGHLGTSFTSPPRSLSSGGRAEASRRRRGSRQSPRLMPPQHRQAPRGDCNPERRAAWPWVRGQPSRGGGPGVLGCWGLHGTPETRVLVSRDPPEAGVLGSWGPCLHSCQDCGPAPCLQSPQGPLLCWYGLVRGEWIFF